jgi:hypothetical protein
VEQPQSSSWVDVNEQALPEKPSWDWSIRNSAEDRPGQSVRRLEASRGQSSARPEARAAVGHQQIESREKCRVLLLMFANYSDSSCAFLRLRLPLLPNGRGDRG